MKTGDDHIAKIDAIMAKVNASPNGTVDWGSGENQREAFALYKAMTGVTKSPTCPACHIEVLDYFRKHVGLPPLRKEATKTLYNRRIEICKGCEHLHSLGMNCELCGCFVHVKARFKMFHCPAGKWPVK